MSRLWYLMCPMQSRGVWTGWAAWMDGGESSDELIHTLVEMVIPLSWV